jgi:trehalose 6-phosphate synthase
MVNDPLSSFLSSLLKDKKLIVALNSEPYTHHWTSSGITVRRGSGGAQHLLDYIMKKTGGLMVALGTGNADRQVVDQEGKIDVPIHDPRYVLKRIFISKQDLDNYYYGFSNQTLWPLCHLAFVKPIFRKDWWDSYKKVNQAFAEVILKEVKERQAFIWVNDYQLCLLPQLLKKHNPNLTVGTFWHIPWPIREIFSICPWSKELLRGLMRSDFIGFHRESYVKNFIDTATVELNIDVLPDSATMLYKDHKTRVDHLPAGIDYEEIRNYITNNYPESDPVKKDFDFDYEYLAIGVDRVDYTKGLIERLHIINSFLEKYPFFHKKFVHLMIGAPTRAYIPAYKDLTKDLLDYINAINWKYSENGWEPIRFINEAIEPDKVYQYYRSSDVCMVTSLDDGMNLVAKEYPICTKLHKGALMLSKYTGASQELTPALHINPFDVMHSIETLHKALTMSQGEKKQRNREMRQILQQNNIDKWAKLFIEKTLNE